MAIDQPAWGQHRVANELAKQGQDDFLGRRPRRPGAPRSGDDEAAAQRGGAKVGQDGRILTEAQLAALERVQRDKKAHGEFESECPGYCGAQDTFYAGTLKGGWADLPTDLYRYVDQSRLAKLYTAKTPVTAADLLNDRVLPFFEQQGIPLNRVLTDRGHGILRPARSPSVRALPGAGRYRPLANDDEKPADEWDL